jgi:hypothetical protein
VTIAPWGLAVEHEQLLERALASPPAGWTGADAGKARLLVYYTAISWAIFPCWPVDEAGVCLCKAGAGCTSPGKHPYPPDGLKAASADAARVLAFHLQRPHFNWAVRTGAVSGIDVVDEDPKHGGPENLAGLLDQLGVTLPETIEAQTGSGGSHRYLAHREGMRNSAGRVAEGVDVRGDEGYVLLPPGNHREHPAPGAYYWVRNPWSGPPAPWPQRLAERALAPRYSPVRIPPPAPDWLREHRHEVPDWLLARVKRGAKEGTRNDEAFKVGCALRRNVPDMHLARSLYEEFCWNCAPAMDEREMERVWRSCCERQDYEPVRLAAPVPPARIARL